MLTTRRKCRRQAESETHVPKLLAAPDFEQGGYAAFFEPVMADRNRMISERRPCPTNFSWLAAAVRRDQGSSNRLDRRRDYERFGRSVPL